MTLNSYKHRFMQIIYASFFSGPTERTITKFIPILLVVSAIGLGGYFFNATWIGFEYQLLDFVPCWLAGEALLKGINIYTHVAAAGFSYHAD